MISYERRQITKDEERNIVTGMIISTEFLSAIRPIYKPELFTLRFARTVAKWCIEFYDNYETAPESDIKSLFEGNKISIRSEEDLEMIESFLENISDQFVENGGSFKVDYEVDKAVQYFKRISLENLTDKIKGAILEDDMNRAESLIATYQRIECGLSSGVDIMRNTDAAISAIRSDSDDMLFKFPGDLGRLIRPIKDKDFVVFLGPAKRKKSFWLQETAIIGMFNNLNVLYISLEMPTNQMLLRIYQRLNGELEPGDEYDRDELVEIPSFDYNYNMNGIINFRKEPKNRLSTKSAIKKMESLQTLMKSKRFHLECFPAGSASVQGGIVPLLDNLEHYNDFIPDLMVLDYADILKPERGGDRRHQIDETWQALRGLGQERSIAIVTASHTNKATFDRDIRQSDLSEDNRKLNHVTLAIALNQSEEDEEKNLQRLCVIADRYKRFSKTTEAVVLQCLDIGMPYLDSRLSKKEEG